jgi:hypothetical protein
VRRVFRRLFTLLALLSLLLFAATIFLWVRSYRVRDRVYLSRIPDSPYKIDTSDPDLPIAMARYNQFFAGTYPGRVEIGRISYECAP